MERFSRANSRGQVRQDSTAALRNSVRRAELPLMAGWSGIEVPSIVNDDRMGWLWKGAADRATTETNTGDQASHGATQYLDNGFTQPTSSSRACGTLMTDSWGSLNPNRRR